jgi:4-carboxymuconolactone decarboxylase
MDPGGVQSLPGSVLTIQCDRSQFSMAQVGTGAEGNARAGRVQLDNDHFVAARLNVRAGRMRQFAGGAAGAPCANARERPVSEKLPPRLDLIPPAELAPAQRALYDAITGGPRASQAGTVPITDADGQLLGPFAIMLLSPEVGNAMQQVGAKIRFGTALTGRERELAILTVAGALNSEFERLAHVPAARGLGLTEPQIDAALAGRTADDLSADEAMVGRLARAMTVDRTLSDEDYSDGVAALGRERLAELTWLVGYYSALALSLAVFRPVLPESFSAGH